jgi:aminopeptidase N
MNPMILFILGNSTYSSGMERPVSSRSAARRMAAVLLVALASLATSSDASHAQRTLDARPTDSGGPLMPEQAAFDVKRYDLDLRVDVDAKSIAGSLTITARVVAPTEWLVLDLDEPLAVESVVDLDAKNAPLSFDRRATKLWVALPYTRQPGETIRARVAYGGSPRVAPRPPWVGGFSWEKTPSGAPWVGVSCQNDGADVWWPCKDHPSDEADEVSMRFTVPKPLTAVANGTLESVEENGDGTRTFSWLMKQPINNYDVTLNVAPYEKIETTYKSAGGETMPVVFWAIPEDAAKARALVPDLLEMVRFYEEKLGPYPFRAEKLGVVQTTYLGMEHSTAIAYGATFKKSEYGFDGLLFHELGHEWWGNMVTAYDWRDMWIHEGFQSFMDALYVEKLQGEAGYRKYLAGLRARTRNKQPVAPRESRTTTQIYMAAPDYTSSDGDIYGKGALVLATLREMMGDERFFVFLRRMAYPDPAMERVTDGRQCRFATTDDVERLAETVSGMKLDWFFDLYLRQPELPRLVVERSAGEARLGWETPDGLPFPMPVEVCVDGQMRRVEMANGKASIAIPASAKLEVDPDRRVLRAE